MAYKWRPSKSQKREFARNMQDPVFAADYYQRKQDKADKRREESKFDYAIAGGRYKPTQAQYEAAMRFLFEKKLTAEQINACNILVSAYSCSETTHHDNIHIVNELIREDNNINL